MRGNEISISGDNADQVGHLFEELVLLLQRGQRLDAADIGRTIDMVKADERPSEVLAAEVLRSSRGRTVRPKTSGQRRYVDAIATSTVTFGIGPAGTGKSYLAVALAVQALQAHTVSRIILTRPAVEAGERLGFLPGDVLAKVDPYLRPALRRPLRHARPRGGQAAAGGRDHRGRPPRLHAGPHPERQLPHPRRGPEHHARADEDVPDPHRLRLQGGRHRRRDPGRPPGRPQRPARPRADPHRHRRPVVRAPVVEGRRAPSHRPADRRRLRAGRRPHR